MGRSSSSGSSDSDDEPRRARDGGAGGPAAAPLDYDGIIKVWKQRKGWGFIVRRDRTDMEPGFFKGEQP
eukprot:gene8092-589_t